MKLYLTTACFPSTVLSDPSCCVFMAKLYNAEMNVDFCTTVGTQRFLGSFKGWSILDLCFF